MDRIRTVYLDSAYAEEVNNEFQYNITGGLSVPEGSRVYDALWGSHTPLRRHRERPY